ncbi:hypothetical protein [Hyphomicrobium sp. DY-1]|uniref:hypothetical protein n=1 Tax=Hyphomicrobium sp. DY-1 TaxID=3075650 RepID=UPI0039C3E69D
MTISTTENTIPFVLSGTTAPLVFPYRIFSLDHLFVEVLNEDGSYTPATVNADYTAVLAEDFSSATVTPQTAWATANAGKTVRLRRTVPLEQTVSLVVNQKLDAKNVERALDLNVMQMQQMDERVNEAEAITEGLRDDVADALSVSTSNAAAAAASAATAVNAANSAAEDAATVEASLDAAAASATAAADSAASAAESAENAAAAAGGGVITFNTRYGLVTAQSGDYDDSMIPNTSSLSGATVKDVFNGIANIVNTALQYKGGWDASSGAFPGTADVKPGWQFKVTVDGVVDGVSFSVGDSIYAEIEDPSTTTYAGNWNRVEGELTTEEVAAVEPELSGAIQKPQGAQTTTSIVDLVMYIGDGVLVIDPSDNAGRWTEPLGFDFDILGWSVIGKQTGSIQMQIMKCAFADFDGGVTHPKDPADTITATGIGFTSDIKATSADPADWTVTSGTAGDMLAVSVDSVTSITQCIVSLKLRKKS